MALQIFLAIDDEKTGPFTLFQVEEKLRSEELQDDTLAWYEGETGWSPLRDLAPFESFFRLRDADLEEQRQRERAERLEKVEHEELVSKESIRPFTRFVARWMDLFLFLSFCLVALAGMIKMGWAGITFVDFFEHQTFRVIVPIYFVLEAWVISQWGTTPGKWMCGIRIVDHDGELLDFWNSLRRSLGAFVVGLGCFLPIIIIATQAYAYVSLKRRGRTFWDVSVASWVEHQPFSAKHFLLPAAVFFLVSTFVLVPLDGLQEQWKVMIEKMQSPES